MITLSCWNVRMPFILLAMSLQLGLPVKKIQAVNSEMFHWMSSEVIKTWVWSAAQRPADRQHGLQGGWRLLSHCWVAPSIGCMLPDITSMNPATAAQQPHMPIPDTACTQKNWLTYICIHLSTSCIIDYVHIHFICIPSPGKCLIWYNIFKTRDASSSQCI